MRLEANTRDWPPFRPPDRDASPESRGRSGKTLRGGVFARLVGSARIAAECAIARARALLEAQEKGNPPSVEPVRDAAKKEENDSQHQAEGVYREYVDKRAQSLADLESTRHQIAGLRATAPLAREHAPVCNWPTNSEDWGWRTSGTIEAGL